MPEISPEAQMTICTAGCLNASIQGNEGKWRFTEGNGGFFRQTCFSIETGFDFIRLMGYNLLKHNKQGDDSDGCFGNLSLPRGRI
jgi:hypothetical protein